MRRIDIQVVMSSKPWMIVMVSELIMFVVVARFVSFPQKMVGY